MPNSPEVEDKKDVETQVQPLVEDAPAQPPAEDTETTTDVETEASKEEAWVKKFYPDKTPAEAATEINRVLEAEKREKARIREEADYWKQQALNASKAPIVPNAATQPDKSKWDEMRQYVIDRFGEEDGKVQLMLIDEREQEAKDREIAKQRDLETSLNLLHQQYIGVIDAFFTAHPEVKTRDALKADISKVLEPLLESYGGVEGLEKRIKSGNATHADIKSFEYALKLSYENVKKDKLLASQKPEVDIQKLVNAGESVSTTESGTPRPEKKKVSFTESFNRALGRA